MPTAKLNLLSFIFLLIPVVLRAHIGPSRTGQTTSEEVNFRGGCSNALAQIDQQINNVRARLTTGGDMWWDGNRGQYIVPKTAAGTPGVSSIFASGIWLGGKDPGGNLKLAAQTYGRSTGGFDYYSGPLFEGDTFFDPKRGSVEPDTCANWDRFFVVNGSDVDAHISKWRRALNAGETKLNPEDIPTSILGWPGRGNKYFRDIHQFNLPQAQQGLADFYDQDFDGMYEPDEGDYPIVGLFFCDHLANNVPDELIFWIYNDSGNDHRNTGGNVMQMEIHGYAFAYKTNDDLNNMTFQKHKLINRSVERLDSTYFALWVDADLGCGMDDYVGCDVDRNLAYVYNADAVDGIGGCDCEGGVETYCDDIPILGIDFLRGPRALIFDPLGVPISEQELKMSSFTYYNNGLSPDMPDVLTGPQTPQEYYNLLGGKWKDGRPFTYGGNGYETSSTSTKYAFSDPPNEGGGWSMCEENLPLADRRMLLSSGEFTLLPGAVNEMVFGTIWIADQNYPCPSLERLLRADDMAQNLFDACFPPPRGPDAPDVDWIELDREIVAVLSNDTLWSNNVHENYQQRGLNIPQAEDFLYRFEGYKIYQFSGPDVTLDDVNDPDKVRLVYQVDKKNGIGKIFNWELIENNEHPNIPDQIYVPELKVEGADQGIRHTFSIKEDQFAEGDRRLVNHKKYYFAAVAYAHNNYQNFNPDPNIYEQGQQRPYLEGDRNIGDRKNKHYTVIPRKILDRQLQTYYGDGPIITRIDGVGTGTNFLDIADESMEEIQSLVREGSFETFSNEITYKKGMAPIDVTIFNPLNIMNGEYELTFTDNQMDNNDLDTPTHWTLRNLSNSTAPVITSEQSIEFLNEQIIDKNGFSISIVQVKEPGEETGIAHTNGVIGYAEAYHDSIANPWLSGIPDDTVIPTGNPALDERMFDYIATSSSIDEDYALDPDQHFSTLGNGFFVPYYLCSWRAHSANLPYLSPAWKNSANQNSIVRHRTSLADLNNVDIIFTSDKSLWSRCVIIETATPDHRALINVSPEDDYIADPAMGQSDMFDLRAHPSVSKEADSNGLPIVDASPPAGEEMGMGWFPGYAIDVETGQRLNIFFGENSAYNDQMPGSSGNGNDMMFNPSDEIYIPPVNNNEPSLLNFAAGGQHYVYVTNQPYDRCAEQLDRFGATSDIRKLAPLEAVTWAGFIVLPTGQMMKSYADGLIPEDVTVKLRVNNPYQVQEGTGEFNGYPTYRFSILSKAALPLDEPSEMHALDCINVIPNPYYGFSVNPANQYENIVKISNLPAKCIVSIYTLSGKLVRQYDRNETAIPVAGNNRAIHRTQILPDIEWDLKNFKGIPIASGVYLIHVSAPGLGERTLKWFGVNQPIAP